MAKSKANTVSPCQREKSMNIKKISNGYIISESSFDKKGNWNSKETFTKVAPKIEVKTK